MTFKFKRQRRPLIDIPLPSYQRPRDAEEPDELVGQVQGMSASAPEERLARALDRARIPYRFRMTAGAPRGMPGWKELDFVASVGGILYAMEVDTAFTHRGKEAADVLHDAIILNDPTLQTMGQFYPQVIHVDGDYDLSTHSNAKRYIRTLFGAADA